MFWDLFFSMNKTNKANKIYKQNPGTNLFVAERERKKEADQSNQSFRLSLVCSYLIMRTMWPKIINEYDIFNGDPFEFIGRT